MLRSTYRPATAATEDPLPDGWTEHQAPSGHKYYHNAETKQSTYTRPVVENDEPLQIDYNATQPDPVVHASIQALDQFHRTNQDTTAGHFTGGRSYQDRSRRRDHGDRPKTKAPIPNCAPWLLVKTRMGRRFVHNTETKQSLYKFPSEVMMAVIDMDRMEWEAKKKAEEESAKQEQQAQAAKDVAQQQAAKPRIPETQDPDDSDSYEEVEVTDDEGEEGSQVDAANKRPRLSPSQATPPPAGPVEFDEDDIEWQLAQMAEDNDYTENHNDSGEELADEEGGLPITESDSLALFRSLLNESRVNPYSTFERVIEDPFIVDDPRYTSLPTVTRRREAFTDWSRDRIAEQQEMQRKAEQNSDRPPPDPKSQYLRFLHANATPKLYWPEFKRKFKKEAEMKDYGVTDKDREKLYRDYITKLKLSEGDRRKELVALLKSVNSDKDSGLNRQTKMDELPNNLTADLRFILLPERKRDELVSGFIETLQD